VSKTKIQISRMSAAFGDKPSGDKKLAYTQLLTSLQAGDESNFKRALHRLVIEFREFYLMGDIAKNASMNGQCVRWLTDVLCAAESDRDLRGLVSYALRVIGDGVIPALRKAWDREEDPSIRGRIHMCMMDIIGGAKTAELAREMPLLAEVEIPLWIETLRKEEPWARLWAVMILAAWARCAPAKSESVRNALSNVVASQWSQDQGLPEREFLAMKQIASETIRELSGS
jgi:hypothetical protein